jgi:hypothetical protein
VLSAKIWWRWLKRPQDLWARLWRWKYTPNATERNLIRWNEDTPGSLIWTTARQNRHLIVNHAFWEIRNGQTALFWNDSWQQLPVLAQEDWVVTFFPPTTHAGLTRVVDYWKDNPTNATWRCWKSNTEDLHVEAQVNLQPWHKMTDERKIPILQGEDILRWGRSPKGTFNIQEAYGLKSNLKPTPSKGSLAQNLVPKTLAQNKHFPMDGGTWQYSHLGESHQKGIYRTFHLSPLPGRGRNYESPSQHLPLQCQSLGPLRNHNAHLRSPKGQHPRMGC